MSFEPPVHRMRVPSLTARPSLQGSATGHTQDYYIEQVRSDFSKLLVLIGLEFNLCLNDLDLN